MGTKIISEGMSRSLSTDNDEKGADSMGNKRQYFVYIGLLVFLFLVRFPSFFFSVFDWDESTFIIMGQSILDGNIPYLDAWDMKPPLSFAIFSLFIALFGKSLAAVRLGGLVCIYISSLLVYRSGKAIHSTTAGIIASLFLIVFVSSGISGLSTMTEHLLLVPVSWGLYMLVVQRVNIYTAFITGLLFGIGMLTKTSLVFESLAVLLLVVWRRSNPCTLFSARIKQCALISFGMGIPLFAVLSYYASHNALDLFIRTNVSVTSLYISATAISFSEKVRVFLSNIGSNMGLNPLLWVTFISGTVYHLFRIKKEPLSMKVPLVFFIFQMASLFVIAQPFGYHYLFTSMPAMALVSGASLSRLLPRKRKGRTAAYLVLLIIVVMGFLYSLQGNVLKYYAEMRSDLAEEKPIGDDTCSRIARFLNAEGVKDQYIYMVNSCQIDYWLTGSRCPTKYIHPSNILLREREYMIKGIDGPGASREKELQAILEKHPKFIIYRNDLWPEDLRSFKDLLDRELISSYELVKTIDTHYEIYELKKNLH